MSIASILLPSHADFRCGRLPFTDNTITVVQEGHTTAYDWGWVVSADESSTTISMLIQQPPRTEIYLSKNKLGDAKISTFRNWLVTHGKLAGTTEAR